MRSTIKQLICIMLLFFLIILNSQPVQAENTQGVTGTCEYDKAYEVLKLVNKERKSRGLNELTMDKDLLEAAMLRMQTVMKSHVLQMREREGVFHGLVIIKEFNCYQKRTKCMWFVEYRPHILSPFGYMYNIIFLLRH